MTSEGLKAHALMSSDTELLCDTFSKYDFLDFGCSSGGNIAFVERAVPGVRGLGIDIDVEKIDTARKSGRSAVVYDIMSLPRRKITNFVTMSHFLEHLQNVKVAGDFVAKAIEVSRDFVHIRQPFFDSDGYLLENNLKLYWSDWTGHKNAITALDFYKVLRKFLFRGEISSFAIFGRGAIDTSMHEAVIPLVAPVNCGKYQDGYGIKSYVEFSAPVFCEILVDIVINISGSEPTRSIIMTKLASKMSMTPIFMSENYQPVLYS